MKLILCGGATGPAVEILKLLANDSQVSDLAVFTHLPPESVRGEQTLLSIASQYDLWRSTNDINECQLPFQPDIIASIYYRIIIKPHVIAGVRGRIFNAHTSLLPRNRGRSPVPWAIINDDKWTGITYHYIDEGIDTGPVILQAAIQIDEDETQVSLFAKINRAVVDFWPAALALVEAGFPGAAQRGHVTYHAAGAPYDGAIDPAWPWGKILRFIRAMTYPPLPYARYEGREIKNEGDYREALLAKNRHRDPVP